MLTRVPTRWLIAQRESGERESHSSPEELWSKDLIEEKTGVSAGNGEHSGGYSQYRGQIICSSG